MKKNIIFIGMIIGTQIIISRIFAEIFLIDLIGILSVIYTMFIAIKKKWIIMLPLRFNILYGLFIISILISNIMLKSGMKNIIKWAEFYIVIWGIYIVVKKYFKEIELTRVIIYSNYLAIILSYLQYFLGNNNEAKYYAAMAPVQLVISSVYFYSKNIPFNSIWIILAVLLSVLIRSRGNSLGIVIFLLFILVEYIINIIVKKRLKLKNILILNLVVLATFISILTAPNLYKPIFDIVKTIDTVKYSTASNNERSMMIEKSINIIKTYPITGVGEENASYYFIGKKSNLTVHNAFLQIGIENGIVSMFLYIIIIIGVSIKIFKIKNVNIYYRYINIVNFITIYELMLSPFSGTVRLRTAIIIAYILGLCSKKNEVINCGVNDI